MLFLGSAEGATPHRRPYRNPQANPADPLQERRVVRQRAHAAPHEEAAKSKT